MTRRQDQVQLITSGSKLQVLCIVIPENKQSMCTSEQMWAGTSSSATQIQHLLPSLAMCMLLSKNHLLTTQQWHPREQKTRVLISSCFVQGLLSTGINRGLCSLLVSHRVYCHIDINGSRNRSNLFQNICSHVSLSHQQSRNMCRKEKLIQGRSFPFSLIWNDEHF